MRESTFNTEIVNSIKEQNWFVHKLMDMPASMMRNTRFTPEKPCDILACIHGKLVGIECKQMKKFQGFAVRFLRDNQIEALNKIVESGGEAYVFVNVRIPAVKGVSKRENRLIVINWKTWDKQLIPIAEIRTMPFIQGRTETIINGHNETKKILFDLNVFCREIGDSKRD